MSINKLDDKWKKDFKDKLGDYRHPVRSGMWDDIANSLPQEKKRNKRILWTWIGSTAAMFTVIIVLAGPRIIHSVLGLDLFDIKTEKTDAKNKGQKGNRDQNKTQDIEGIDSEKDDDELINAPDSIDYESVNMDTIHEKAETEKVEEQKEVSGTKQDKKMIVQKGNRNQNKTQNVGNIDSEKDNKELIDAADNADNKSVNSSNTGNKKGKQENTNNKEQKEVSGTKQDENIEVNNTKPDNYKKNEKVEDNKLQQEYNLNITDPDTSDTTIEDNMLPADTLAERLYSEADEPNKEPNKIKKPKVKKDYSSWSFAITSKNLIYNDYHKQWGKMEAPNPPASVDTVVGRKKQFNHPINIGLTIRKQLNNRWAIEGGLSYTYLRSTETIINSISPATITNVKIHNIGLSARVEYMLYRSRRMDIYSKYGAMVEKTKSNNRIKGWQMSTSLSGGLSYKLGKNIGIFIEPGATYYFDNNTALPTLRNEVPLNFDVSVGLRLYPFSR